MSDSNGRDWQLIFYVQDSGASPVEDFLRSQDRQTRMRFGWLIDRLLERNVTAREPLVKKIDDKLWELRCESRTSIYRLIFSFVTGRQIVLLHASRKRLRRRPVAKSRLLAVV